MDNDRWQEIKEYSQFVDECEYPEGMDVIEMHRYLKELIAAVEAAMAELAEAQAESSIYKEQLLDMDY